MFRSRHGLFLLFASTMMLLVMASMAYSGKIARENAEMVKHTNVVIGAFLQLRAVVSEAESTATSYALAGGTSAPAALNDAHSESAKLLDTLQKLTPDSAAQQQRLKALAPVVTDRLKALQTLAEARTNNASVAEMGASVQRGSGIMTEMLRMIDEGVRHERDLDARRERELMEEFQKLTFTGIGGAVLAVATGIASMLLLQRSHLSAVRGIDMEQAAEKAREADVQKSRFLANMSHEIRTPMNAILGFTDLLGGMVTEPRARAYLASIQSSGRSLLELINEILDLSRVEAGKLELRTEPTDVRELVEAVAVMLKKQAMDKGISLDTKIIGAVPPLLEVDSLRLRQVLVNLVTNAVKFTHRGGVKVLLSSTPVSESAWDLRISVSDTGVGIAAEDQSRIFAPFEQASVPNSVSAHGSGLGLSIVRKLAGLMGGEVTVRSEVGKGSEFTVTLPGVPVSQKEADPPSSRTADFDELRPASILIVDDNATNRELIAGFFNGSHHELLFAEDGMEALELARHAKPDIILMDIRMPRMDGKWARQILHQDERTRTIPVIAQTASSLPEDSEHLRHIFNGYLRKPFSARQLYKELEPLLGHATLRHVAPLPVKHVSADMPVSVTESLDAHTSASWPGLAKHLIEMAHGDILRFRDTLPMREIAAFASSLQVLAARHDCPPLGRYASALVAASEGFDLEQVERLLSEFSIVAERITGVAMPEQA
ncbi:MAG: ATP-binding protein [Prosthecobacter sp.]